MVGVLKIMFYKCMKILSFFKKNEQLCRGSLFNFFVHKI